MEVASHPRSNYLSSSYRSEPDHSLEEVNFNDFYPKKSTIFEKDGLKIPFSLVPGEYVVYIGSMNNGIIALSNFRLFVSEQHTLLFNLPLGLIDYIEALNLVSMAVFCKDGKTFKCTFSTNEKCNTWMGWVGELMTTATRLPSCFALTFCAWCLSDKIHLDPFFYQPDSTSWMEGGSTVFDRETTRMGFNLNSDTKAWRICHANQNYDICDTYPQSHIVPWCISDDMLGDMSKYRAHRRFPSVVWRDTETGLVLVRSSQPNVGVFWWRNSSDEAFLKSIGRSCHLNPGPAAAASHGDYPKSETGCESKASVGVLNAPRVNEGEVTKDLLLIDARSFAAATVNRAKGGGVECDEYYPNVNVVFMNLPNIHAIKKSFNLLRALSANSVDDACWWSSLETSRWFNYLSNLLKSALVVVDSIRVEGRSVLVHCSDGWDRTPQIISLGQILMDPHYRTIEGFHDLVQREWLEFGHRFSDRCGQGIVGHGDYDSKSPIFLQWLDCIHQLHNQFPCSFQFNMNFLVKMAEHTYSCLFGEFLYNSDLERSRHRQPHKTASIWSFLLNNHRFVNPLYRPCSKALRPSYNTRDMHFWSQVYTSSSQPIMTSSLLEEITHQSDACDDDDDVDVDDDDCVTMNGGGRMMHGGVGEVGGEVKRREEECAKMLLKCNGRVTNGFVKETRECDADKNININNFNNNNNNNDQNEDVTVDKIDHNGVSNDTNDDIDTDEKANNDDKDTNEKNNNDDNDDDNTNDDEETYKYYNGDNEDDGDAENYFSNKDSRPTRRRSLSSCNRTSNGVCSAKEQEHLQNGKACNDQLAFVGDTLRRTRRESLSSSGLEASKTSPIAIQANKHAFAKHHHLSSPKLAVGGDHLAGDFSHSYRAEFLSSSSPRVSRGKHNENIFQPEVSRDPRIQHLIDTDGLTIFNDPVSRSVYRMQRTYQSKILRLQRMVKSLRKLIIAEPGVGGSLLDAKEDASSDGSSPPSSGGSAVSWEVLSESQDRMVLWVPDHHVTHCTGCEREFWIALRKHHCRSCGRIYCHDCTNHCIPCPEQDLNAPVRVCKTCFETVKTLSIKSNK